MRAIIMIKLSEDQQWLYISDKKRTPVEEIRLATPEDNEMFTWKDNNITSLEGDRIISVKRSKTTDQLSYYRIDFHGNITSITRTIAWKKKLKQIRYKQKKDLPISSELLHQSLKSLRPSAESVFQSNASTESDYPTNQTDLPDFDFNFNSDFDDAVAQFYPDNGENNEQKIYNELFSLPPSNTNAPMQDLPQPPTKRMRTSNVTLETESKQETQSQIPELNDEALDKQAPPAIMKERLETLTKTAKEKIIAKRRELAEIRRKADLEIQLIKASVEEAIKNANIFEAQIIDEANKQTEEIIANSKQQINPERENVVIAEEKSSVLPEQSINEQSHRIYNVKFSNDRDEMLDFFDRAVTSWQYLDIKYKQYFGGLRVTHQGKSYQAVGAELYFYFSHAIQFQHLDAMSEIWNKSRKTIIEMISPVSKNEKIKMFRSILSLNIKINNQATSSPKLKEQSEAFILSFFSAADKKDNDLYRECLAWLATVPRSEATRTLLENISFGLNANQENHYSPLQPRTSQPQNTVTEQYDMASVLASLGMFRQQEGQQYSENLSPYIEELPLDEPFSLEFK